jgi:hypothetical protein
MRYFSVSERKAKLLSVWLMDQPRKTVTALFSTFNGVFTQTFEHLMPSVVN